MIDWSGSIEIHQPPEVVFDFLANIQDVDQPEGSPVLALELLTEGPPGLGSRYKEVVQMMPFVKGEILSEITAFEFPSVLEMAWHGAGMRGVDRYQLDAENSGTLLKHTKHTSFQGILQLLEPILRLALIPRLEGRLTAIKHLLEAGDYQASTANK